ncbi:MAG: helix-hairpin-helix domain-containing protein [candidate division WOR-3 bacterium]|nr:helix-hairpin-helix domain-containing protein [candidate division WOR-3 bacterium]
MVIILLISLFSQDLLEEDIELPKETITQEVFEELSTNPLEINTAGYEELIRIPYLTPVTVNQILLVRKKKGKFNSISELLEIPSIDIELFDNIKHFITIREQKPPKIQSQLQTKIILDSLKNLFRTEEWETATRLKFSLRHLATDIRMIFLTDKDAKERSFTDFSSSSISITTRSNRIVLGNYTMNFGSQLLFAGPTSYLNPSKNFSLEPNRALNEVKSVYTYPSLFGVGYFQQLSDFGIYTYLSSSYLSAEIKDGYVYKIYYYTKFIDSTTIARRNQLRADLMGLRITYSQPSFMLGLTSYHNRYDKQFAPKDSTNSFYGSNLNLFSIDGKTHLGHYFLRSEIGYSLYWGFGASGQIIGDWRCLKVNFDFYAQQKNFFSPYSRWKTLTSRKDQIYAKFNIYYNLIGFKMYFYTSTKQNFISDSLPARVQFRINRKQGPIEIGLVLKSNYQEAVLTTYGTRFDFNYQVLKNLNLVMRIEDRYVKDFPKLGRLFSCGAKLTLRQFKIESQIYYFDVNSSDCKIYVYESGAQGLNRNFVFNKRGLRIFSSFESHLFRYLKIAGRIGFTKIQPELNPLTPTHNQNLDSAVQLTFEI